MLVYQFVETGIKSHSESIQIGVEDAHFRGTGTSQALNNSLFGYLEGSLADRHLIEDLIEMGDTVCHLVILCDDMCHHKLLAILPRRMVIVGIGVIGQAACLAHLLEHNAIHAATEIFIEHLLNSSLLWIPRASFVVIHTHIYILGIVGGYQHLVICRRNLKIGFVLWYCSQLLGRDMRLFDKSCNLLFFHRAIVDHLVCVVGKPFQQIGEQLGISLFQRLFTHHVTITVALTRDGIGIQIGETSALTLLRIITAFQNQLHHLVVSLPVSLGMLQQILQKSKCLRHVLMQARQADGDILRTDIHTPVASQLIELLTEISSRHLVCAQIFDIISCDIVAVVCTLSEIIVEHQIEEAILLVLHVIERQIFFGFQDGEILFQVYEMRQDRLYLRILNSLHKGTLLITISLDRGDDRLVDLLLQTVDALLLEDGNIAIGEELVGKGHQLLLRDLRDAVDTFHLLFPVHFINKGPNKHACTPAIALQQGIVRAFHVVDDTGQQVIREVALLQLINLSEHQAPHLFKGLTLLGSPHQKEPTMVMQQLATTCCTLYFHRLVQIEVEESSPAIAQHVLHQLEGISLQRISLFGTPSHPYLLSLLPNYSRILRCRQWWQRGESGLFDISSRCPTAKVLLDDGNSLVWIQVTCHTDGYIIGTIPLAKVVLDIRYRGILQMFLGANGCL